MMNISWVFFTYETRFDLNNGLEDIGRGSLNWIEIVDITLF